jgi:hypothetical protein
MRKAVSVIALVLMIFSVGALVASSDASAQYRQFKGKIDKIDKKLVIVDNRKGDKVKFMKMDETVVEGEGKASWEDLKKGDWASVDWKFIDKPRKAYKVLVIPAPPEEGDD